MHTPFTFGEPATIARGAFAGRTAVIIEWADERFKMPWDHAATLRDPLAVGFAARVTHDTPLFADVVRTKYGPNGGEMATYADPAARKLVVPRFDGGDVVVARFEDGVEVLVHLAELA